MRQSCCRGLFLNWEEGERPGSFSDFKFLKILGCSNSFHGFLLSAVFLSQELLQGNIKGRRIMTIRGKK
jgi:hypothetical protein